MKKLYNDVPFINKKKEQGTAELQRQVEDVTSSLAQKANQINIVNQPIKYGEIDLPSDFRTLPFGLYRKQEGYIQHNADFNQFKTGTTYYVNVTTGNDTTGDGTSGLPYKTIAKALTVISGGADGNYVIKVQSTRFNRDQTCPTNLTLTNKTVAIIPDTGVDRILMNNGQSGLSWTADGTGTWKATRSGVYTVYDLRKKDAYGVPYPLDFKPSLAECQATPNTWYSDNVTVWVHPSDNLVPNDNNFIIGLGTLLFTATLLGTSKLYFENCDLIGGNVTTLINFKGDATGATVVGEVWANNCKFVGGANKKPEITPQGNCITVENIKSTYFFNCLSAYGNLDGFNYHYVNVPLANRRDCLAFEYNCVSYKHGLRDLGSSNNATTAHEGVCTLRIGSVGYKCPGPLCADVNDCYSILYDCDMHDQFDTNDNGFYFSGTANSGAKAILNNCGAMGTNMVPVATANVPTTLINFKGMIENTNNLIIIS
jgi:hypothetical protein